jgi:hypothetical protein
MGDQYFVGPLADKMAVVTGNNIYGYAVFKGPVNILLLLAILSQYVDQDRQESS